jgi:hypothetical protein
MRLALEDKVAAENLLFEAMAHKEDKKLFVWAFGFAIVLHIVVLFVQFPEFKKAFTPKKSANVIVVKKYVPPPPQVERKQVVKKKLTRKVPMPDPTRTSPSQFASPSRKSNKSRFLRTWSSSSVTPSLLRPRVRCWRVSAT